MGDCEREQFSSQAEKRPLVDEGVAGPPSYAATEGSAPKSVSPRGAAIAAHSAGDEQDDAATNNRRQSMRASVQAARHTATVAAVGSPDMARSPLGLVMFVISCLLVLVPVVATVYVEVRCWQVLYRTWDKPCDKELALWLLMRNSFTVAFCCMPSREGEAKGGCLFWFCFLVWQIIGFVQVRHSNTCEDTNPDLFSWVQFVTVWGMCFTLLILCAPLIIFPVMLVYQLVISRGLLKSPNAAVDGTIERMQVVPYSAEVFGPTAERQTALECSCCVEEFGHEKTIVRAPCSHHFHTECLTEWLKLSKTCPLCRETLDVDGKATGPTPLV